MEIEPSTAIVPPPPRRPSKAARSLVFGYAGSQGAQLVAGIVLVAVGVPVSVLFGWGLWSDVAIDLGRETTPGTIVGMKLNESVEINDQHPTTVSFVYAVGDRAFTGETDVLEPSFPESIVEVEYARSDPGTARLAGETAATFGYWSALLLLLPAVGALLTARAVRSNRREIRAYTHGTPVLADVTYAGDDTAVEINHRHPYLVRWSFTAGGAQFTGSLSALDSPALRELGSHRQVVVLYVPEDPASNTLWIA